MTLRQQIFNRTLLARQCHQSMSSEHCRLRRHSDSSYVLDLINCGFIIMITIIY